jgi:hypothetical protein
MELTDVCVGSGELHLFYFEAPAAPGGDSLSGCAAATRFNRNSRGGRRTRHVDLLLRRLGCPVFCMRQAAAVKKQEIRPLKKKKTFYIALQGYVRYLIVPRYPLWPITMAHYCPL